jgi:hypothetical protein
MRRVFRFSPSLFLLVAAGCGAGVISAPDTESTEQGLLPAAANWASVPLANSFGPPNDAIVIANDTDGRSRYACRGSYNLGIEPGQTRGDWLDCRFGFGGSEEQASQYQVLVPAWTAAANGVIPVDALPIGNEATGSPLYMCRGSVAGSTQLGKIGPGGGACYVPYGGQEVHVASYEVLTGTLPLARVDGDATYLGFAVRGGRDGDGVGLWPCVAEFNGGLHPGKTRPFWNACDVSWGGTEHFVSPYQLLRPELEPAPLGGAHAWQAGNDPRVLLTPGQPLGVCVAQNGTFAEVGKYLASGACNFAEGGYEVSLPDGFTVLAAQHPAYVPSSFNYGLLQNGTHVGSTITLVAYAEDDVTAVVARGLNAAGYRVASITSWKANGGADPIVDQHVDGSGPLHVHQGERVTVDFTLDADSVNYARNDNSIVVSGHGWSFTVPAHADVDFVGARPALVFGRDPKNYADQISGLGSLAAFSVTVTNVGTQAGTYVLSAATDHAGLTVDPGQWFWYEAAKLIPAGTTMTIAPGEVQTIGFEIDVAKDGSAYGNALVTATLVGSGANVSVVDTLSVVHMPCAGAGTAPWDRSHEDCCGGTHLVGALCQSLPCAPLGQKPNTSMYNACCAPNIGSPCTAPPPPCAPAGKKPNANGYAACCPGLVGSPCAPPPPCAGNGVTPNSGGRGACCPGLTGSPCHPTNSCAVLVEAHATTCTNWYDGTPSSYSHTLCADGCGATRDEAEANARKALQQQTCLGSDWGCCDVTIDQNFSQCGE